MDRHADIRKYRLRRGQPDEQQRGVVAQVARLQAAHRGRQRPDEARAAADERAVDEHALDRRVGEAPEPGDRADDQEVDRLVEVPLVDEELVQARRSAPGSRRRCRPCPRSARRSPMPARPMTAPTSRPIHSDVAARLERPRRARSPRTSARGSGAAPSVTPGICRKPPTIASSGQRAHRDLHRRGPLGDVVLGAGEADVGVLDLAGGRVGRLGRVVEVPVRELLGLRAHLAVERAEDHPERVDRGQERADVADHAEDRVPAAAVELERDDLVLGEEARERRDARQREAADDHAAVRERHRPCGSRPCGRGSGCRPSRRSPSRRP